MKNGNYMIEAVQQARMGMRASNGGPFGAIVVKNNTIVGRGHNLVTAKNDPTAHAEIVAIREACKKLKTFQLTGCTIYTSCEPCPMCLGAIYWARPDRVYYASTRRDAAAFGFDDQLIYREVALPCKRRLIPFVQLGRRSALSLFSAWSEKADKIPY